MRVLQHLCSLASAQIFNIPDTVAFENLDVAQRQALINNELQNWQKDARARAHVLFRA